MNEILELETYLSISQSKFGIYLFDTKNSKNLYAKEVIFKETNLINYFELKKFLDENIFKIEKLIDGFIENIFLLIEDENILNIQIGINHKNYNPSASKVYIQSSITNAKDLFKKNFPNQRIMHIIINEYLIDGESYSFFRDNLKFEQINLVIQFKSISDETIYNLNKLLQNYQITINRFLDSNYIQNFLTDDTEISKKAHNIINGCNENEVIVVQKNSKKLGFFEKFFQLFS